MDLAHASVVVVEDNLDNLLLAVDLLQAMGVKTLNTKPSGVQFFKLIETGLKVDLILLDIQIPHEDGYKILKNIRATPSLEHVRVVALTANVMPEDVARARQAGFDGFIGKPIAVKRFPVQIRRVLNGESVWEP